MAGLGGRTAFSFLCRSVAKLIPLLVFQLWNPYASLGFNCKNNHSSIIAFQALSGLGRRAGARFVPSPRMPWSFSDASSNSVKGVKGGRKAAASASSAPFISPHPKVQKPKDLPGTEWWGTVLRNSLEHKRLKLGPQKRPIIFESSLSGTI